MPEFTDQVAGSGGTGLDAAHLSALVVAQNYLLSGGLPPTAASLAASQPLTEVVVAGLYSKIAAATLTAFPANRDNYVDVDSSGTYHYGGGLSVTNGSAAPAVTAGALRLYMAVTNGSAITAVTQLASANPLAVQDIVAARGTANGLATLNSSGYGAQRPDPGFLSLPGGGTYHWGAADKAYLLQTGTGATVYLPGHSGSSAPFAGQTVTITNGGSTTSTSVVPDGASSINGLSAGAAYVLASNLSSVTLLCDGTFWYVIASH